MIAAEAHQAEGPKEAHAQGWLVSILLHGTVAFAAILLMKQVTIMPKDEAFKWNVAMVSPTQLVQSTAPTQNQYPAQSGPSTTSTPISPTQQTTPTQTLSSPQLQAQQITPSISERITPILTEAPAPTPAELTTSARPTPHTTQPAEPLRHETLAPMVDESTSIVEPADTPTDSSGESDVQTVASGQSPTQVAAISPVLSNVPSKRDYGWLSETVLRRVEELKRYPASARVEPAEGKVVLKVVINENGSIGEVEVFQSSGHPALDKAAVETMREAAPFHLPRSLGQARKTLKIPMNYHLDR